MFVSASSTHPFGLVAQFAYTRVGDPYLPNHETSLLLRLRLELAIPLCGVGRIWAD